MCIRDEIYDENGDMKESAIIRVLQHEKEAVQLRLEPLLAENEQLKAEVKRLTAELERLKREP